MRSLFAVVAATSITMAGANTVATLLAAKAVGQGWSGLANATGVLGTATGALLLSKLMAGRGRRIGLTSGFAFAVAGAVLGAVAAVTGWFPLLLLGMIGLGVGNGGAQLARYAAADLYAPERRATALATIVWAGTIGAVIGPSLISPAASAAVEIGLPSLSGTFILAGIIMAMGWAVALLLPRDAAPTASPQPVATATEDADHRTSEKRTVLALPLAAMVSSQVAMVGLMTMTPVHLQAHGHGLGTVGAVLSAHMLGMFALAPLSGKVVDRFGAVSGIVAGVGTLVSASVTAILASTPSAGLLLPVALFLLGYGWNLCFVAGSSMLSSDLAAEVRTRLQGRIDAVVWVASAVASVSSGRLLAVGDYAFLAGVAGLVALVPVIFLVRRTSRARAR